MIQGHCLVPWSPGRLPGGRLVFEEPLLEMDVFWCLARSLPGEGREISGPLQVVVYENQPLCRQGGCDSGTKSGMASGGVGTLSVR